MSSLRLANLTVSVAGRTVLSDVSFSIKPGEIVALMGPNGSGKSSLANTIMGHPAYQVVKGKASLGRKNLLSLSPDARAQAGMFLAFQYPVGITGVNVRQMLLAALRARGLKFRHKAGIITPRFKRRLLRRREKENGNSSASASGTTSSHTR